MDISLSSGSHRCCTVFLFTLWHSLKFILFQPYCAALQHIIPQSPLTAAKFPIVKRCILFPSKISIQLQNLCVNMAMSQHKDGSNKLTLYIEVHNVNMVSIEMTEWHGLYSIQYETSVIPLSGRYAISVLNYVERCRWAQAITIILNLPSGIWENCNVQRAYPEQVEWLMLKNYLSHVVLDQRAQRQTHTSMQPHSSSLVRRFLLKGTEATDRYADAGRPISLNSNRNDVIFPTEHQVTLRNCNVYTLWIGHGFQSKCALISYLSMYDMLNTTHEYEWIHEQNQ